MAAKTRKRAPQSVTHTVTTGSTIRIEQPKSERGKPGPATVIIQEVNPVGGFVNFLREYAVVGLAIGFVVGLQAQGLIKQLVDSFINPAFLLLFGGERLQSRNFVLHFGEREQTFAWGMFAYVLLNFLFVLIAIYAVVKLFKLDKLKKQEDPKK